MPKIKTHSGLKKRLKRTGSGKLKRSHAYISHLSHNTWMSRLNMALRCRN